MKAARRRCRSFINGASKRGWEPYAELIPRAERTPVLDPIVPDLVGRSSVTLRRRAFALV